MRPAARRAGRTAPFSPRLNPLAAHALQTLPDSLAERRALLQEIVRCTPRGTGLRQTAAMMLRHLAEQDRARSEFSVNFQPFARPGQ